MQGRRDPKGLTARVDPHGGRGRPPPEENTDLPDFTPEFAHMLLQESMETTRIATMGRTWTGESWTTPSVIIVGDG